VAIELEASALGDDAAVALDGGEDHGLFACFPAGTPLPGGFRRIGIVAEGSGVRVDGVRYDRAGGWDPYLGWDGRVG
jgi:thiamine-monophosphate kinase